MSGNVYEWCADWDEPYPVKAVIDPRGQSEGQDRVLRGGGWNFDGRDLRAAGGAAARAIPKTCQ